ncbi:Gfo/Idh/MocA family protein [Brachybacterium sp. FME24]|uniref:Gfo/Idh/MocA family protein n=1 Tax=Brachybacterium sp. FME24 TaxID=2742605 RepID=UPI001865F6A9|nr:Gfo/Idh/MocA family oxidoreductase [Brachybacterium sp. FME24]
MNDSSTAGSLRFGVIGVGIIGRQHVARLLSDASPATLIALADANPEAARTVAEENGVEASASVEELLGRDDIDVVVIAVPSGLHADVTIDALDAGKHVFLEKPIEVTVEASDRIREAEQRSGKILSIASQRRFAAENQFLKTLVSEGKLGRLTSATVEVPLWRSQEYYDSGAWRGTWKLDGGGALMNQGVHLVDLALWLLGDVEELFAFTGLLAHERIEVEDTVTATARLRSGAQLTFQATTAAYGKLPIRVSLMGDAGSIVTESERVIHFHSRDGLELPEFEAVDIMLEQHLDFVDAVQNEHAPLVTSADARAAVAFIEAVYESGRTGKPVRPAELPVRA